MWWWVLIWTLLVAIAAAFLAARMWGLWGQVKELTSELERASQTLSALEAEVDRLGNRPAVPGHTLFEDPSTLRREREATRARLREQQKARRAGRLPRWARDVD